MIVFVSSVSSRCVSFKGIVKIDIYARFYGNALVFKYKHTFIYMRLCQKEHLYDTPCIKSLWIGPLQSW